MAAPLAGETGAAFAAAQPLPLPPQQELDQQQQQQQQAQAQQQQAGSAGSSPSADPPATLEGLRLEAMQALGELAGLPGRGDSHGVLDADRLSSQIHQLTQLTQQMQQLATQSASPSPPAEAAAAATSRCGPAPLRAGANSFYFFQVRQAGDYRLLAG